MVKISKEGQKVWDLTLEEIVDLIDKLSDMLGEQQELENAFWQILCLRLGVPPTTLLIANVGLGKVWVKGALPEMAQYEKGQIIQVDERG